MKMNSIITYRTDRIEDLKKLAEEKEISLSQLSGDIISDYFEFAKLYSTIERYTDSREIVSICFESMDKSSLDKLLEIAINDITTGMEALCVDSFEKLTDKALTYFRLNSFKLEQFDKGSHVNFVSKNPMPKNWNIYVSTVITRLYKNLGYDGLVESAEKGFLSFKILKQK